MSERVITTTQVGTKVQQRASATTMLIIFVLAFALYLILQARSKSNDDDLRSPREERSRSDARRGGRGDDKRSARRDADRRIDSSEEDSSQPQRDAKKKVEPAGGKKGDTPQSSAIPDTALPPEPPTPLTNTPLSDKRWARDKNKRPQRPSGRDSAVRLRRDNDGNWTRPPLGGKKVQFGPKGKEATGIVGYQKDDPSDVLYDRSDDEDLLHNGRWGGRTEDKRFKGEDDDIPKGQIDGSESPLKKLIGYGRLSSELLKRMKLAEEICGKDLLDPRHSRETLALATQDDWVDKLGPVPRYIFDVVLQIIQDRAIDVPAVMAEFACHHPNPNLENQPKTLDDLYNRLNKYLSPHMTICRMDINEIAAGFKIKEWVSKTRQECREVVKDWTMKADNPTGKSGAAGKICGPILLGFFLPSYRANISFKYQAVDKTIPPTLEKSLGGHTLCMIKWLKYMGKICLISRMFSPAGAYVSPDLSLSVAIARRPPSVPHGYVRGFIFNYTVYLPKEEDSVDKTMAILDANFQMGVMFIKRLYALALLRTEHLGNTTMRLPTGQNPFDKSGALDFGRMFLRPGIPLRKLDSAIVRRCVANKGLRPPPPTTAIIPIDISQLKELFRLNSKSHGIFNEFARLFGAVPTEAIVFNNQTQHHWYAPSGGAHTHSGFSKLTVGLLLFCMSLGVKTTFLSGNFVAHKFSKVEHKDGGVGDYYNNYTADYVFPKMIDLGTLIPLVNPQISQPTFIPLDDFDKLRILVLPYASASSKLPGSHPASASLVCKDSWMLNKYLYGPKGITIVFVGKNRAERAQFMRELAEGFFSHFAQSGIRTGSDAWSHRIAGAVIMVKEKVKFRASTDSFPELRPEEEILRLGLPEFEIPK